MPLLIVSGLWGVMTTFIRGRPRTFGALQLLLIASASTAAAMMVYGWIFERFTADFMPLLVFAAMIGMVDVWRRVGLAPRNTLVVIPVVAGALAIFGFWANMGYAVTPTRILEPHAGEQLHQRRADVQRPDWASPRREGRLRDSISQFGTGGHLVRRGKLPESLRGLGRRYEYPLVASRRASATHADLSFARRKSFTTANPPTAPQLIPMPRCGGMSAVAWCRWAW